MIKVHEHLDQKGALTKRTRSVQENPDEESLLRSALEGRLDDLAPLAIQVAQETGDPIGRVLTETLKANPNPTLAFQLFDQIPSETVALREVGAGVTRQCLEDWQRRGVPVKVARYSSNLANRLSELGQREEALAAAEEAVTIIRALAADQPDAFHDDLADSLHTLAIMLSELGQREEALAAAEEAVDLYRKLAAEQPEFRHTLVQCLNNLMARCRELGRREEALAAAEEATDLCSDLANKADRPDAFRFYASRAASLNNLAIALGELGRREEALTAAEECVTARRALAEARPDGFRSDLAGSLITLGNRLRDLGRREEALTKTKEAVDIHRALADARPDAFRPTLAASLNNLAIALGGLGLDEEALDAAKKAVDIRRTLAALQPDAFRPFLARSLHTLGNRLRELGRREEAIAAMKEAVDIHRALAAARDVFRPDLAASLNNLAITLRELGRREEAMAAMKEAVTLELGGNSDAAIPIISAFAALRLEYSGQDNTNTLDQALEQISKHLRVQGYKVVYDDDKKTIYAAHPEKLSLVVRVHTLVTLVTAVWKCGDTAERDRLGYLECINAVNKSAVIARCYADTCSVICLEASYYGEYRQMDFDRLLGWLDRDIMHMLQVPGIKKYLE